MHLLNADLDNGIFTYHVLFIFIYLCIFSFHDKSAYLFHDEF